MTTYLQHAHGLLQTFKAYEISQIPRYENNHADTLARPASALEQGNGHKIHMEFLDKLSTKTPVVCTIDRSLTWMDPILQFLQYQ